MGTKSLLNETSIPSNKITHSPSYRSNQTYLQDNYLVGSTTTDNCVITTTSNAASTYMNASSILNNIK